MAQRILELTQIQAKHQQTINRMIQYMIDMKLDEFDEALSKIIDNLGIKDVLIEIIFPFLERIGMLWITGHINPAQEHFVSNIIRQKLLSATDDLPVPLHSKNKVLMFLPEGELHEIGILFIQYLLKRKGLQNWYLGANVPMTDLVFVAKEKQPSYIYTYLTAVTQNFSLHKFITQIQESIPSIPLIVSGPAITGIESPVPSGVHFMHSPKEVFSFIESLTA